jgi:hypothetical protein
MAWLGACITEHFVPAAFRCADTAADLFRFLFDFFSLICDSERKVRRIWLFHTSRKTFKGQLGVFDTAVCASQLQMITDVFLQCSLFNATLLKGELNGN